MLPISAAGLPPVERPTSEGRTGSVTNAAEACRHRDPRRRFGRRPEHADLADRFLDHDIMSMYRDAVRYQEDRKILGYEPLTGESMAELNCCVTRR
jgi:hypothetical protein